MAEIRKALCVLNPQNGYAFTDNEAALLLEKVLASPIRGRGYQGLPLSERWRAFAEKEGPKELVCLCSGTCSEALLDANEEAVWTGIALAAKAFGLEEAWVALDHERSIPDSRFGIALKCFTFEHTPAAGEETRLFAMIEGDIPLTRPQPPYPTERGLFGRPTLIHSAELFAHLPYLLRDGDADTKLVYCSGAVEKPGIYEVNSDAPLSELLAEAGAVKPKAVQLGGCCGYLLPFEKAGGVPVYGEAALPDAIPGEASVRVIGQNECPVRLLKENLRTAYPASCGRCVFCREGLYQMYLLMEDLGAGKGRETDLPLLKDLAYVIAEQAACDYGRMAGRMVVSALAAFYEEFEAHLRKKCPALDCPGMFTLHIDPAKCTGCGDCLSRCPEKAILGGTGLIHVVNQERCTQCMACLPCPADAFLRAGLLKPAGPEQPVPVGSFVPKKKGLQRRPKV